MTDSEFLALLELEYESSMFDAHSPKDLENIWRELWKRVKTGLPLQERDHKYNVTRDFVWNKFPSIRDAVANRSARPYGGRHKVDPGSAASSSSSSSSGSASSAPVAMMGSHAAYVTNNKRKRAAEDADEDAPKPKDVSTVGIEEYLQPTGLFMAQPQRLRARKPTVSFANPANSTKHPAVVSKKVPRQQIDAARIKYWSRQERKSFQQQNDVMGCSAELAATAARLQVMLSPSHKQQWEWLHLCSFKMGGIDGTPQSSGNLVAGTYDCNTEMMAIEEAIKMLALEGHVFHVSVNAYMYPDTHVAMEIEYVVECNGITSTTHFFPMSTDTVVKGETQAAIKLLRSYFKLDRSSSTTSSSPSSSSPSSSAYVTQANVAKRQKP